MTPILSLTFAPPTTATKGALGLAQDALHKLDFLLQEQASRLAVHVLSHAGRRGVGAVGSSKGVVDVNVG